MRKFPLIFILLMSTLATPQEAYACSCIGYEDTNERNEAWYKNADLIVQGSPIAVTEEYEGDIAFSDSPIFSETSFLYTISVEKVWKGKADAYIEIKTANNGASCGIDLLMNESSLIFINTDNNTYYTGLCTGTTPSKDADAIVEWLSSYEGEPHEPEVGCTPFICDNGDVHPSCTEEGNQINYLVHPCQFSEEKPEPEEETRTFTDVPSSHPNAKAISFVRNEGIVKGYENGTFRPDQTINRAEFTKIIITANFAQSATDNCESEDLFSDVHQSDWFADYVCVGKNDNVINGYDDGTFKPSNPVNFAEAAKIVVNAFVIPTNPEDEILSVWWKPYVFALSRIGGLPPSFTDPNQLLTRGEMAEIIYRVMTGM